VVGGLLRGRAGEMIAVVVCVYLAECLVRKISARYRGFSVHADLGIVIAALIGLDLDTSRAEAAIALRLTMPYWSKGPGSSMAWHVPRRDAIRADLMWVPLSERNARLAVPRGRKEMR